MNLIPNTQFPIPRIDYIISLGDTPLILSQRTAEWCGHGPILEQDIAITNISLDLLGQARNFFQYAARLMNESSGGNEVTEDSLAYLRDAREFKNCLLVELPNGDWAQTVLRQFFVSNYQFVLFTALGRSSDEQLAAIAGKSLKEVGYHLRWSSEWVVRLGDGTPESHARMMKAAEFLWPYTGELFMPASYEEAMAQEGIGVDPSTLREDWDQRVKSVFEEATLPLPSPTWYQRGGKTGEHSEHLGFILAEMQFLQRAYPGSEW